jgi:autoinducer 2-degrading protein
MSYALVVRIRIKPENVETFMQKLEANAAAARKEPGCLAFNVLVDPADRTRVMLYEVYASEAAFQAHQAQTPFKVYMEEAVPLLAERNREFFTRVSH